MTFCELRELLRLSRGITVQSFTGLSYILTVSGSTDLAEAVRTVLKHEISRLFGESSPQSFNKSYLSQHSNSIPHRLAGTQTWW